MFKYPQNPPPPAPGKPSFAENDVPAEWGTPVSQPAAAPVEGGFFGGEETVSSPFDMGAASGAPATTTRNVLNYDVSVVGTLRFTDDLLVDGSVEGEITSDGVLTVGANASIQAGEKNKVAVRTQSAIIHGKVVGDIVVTDRVELAATAEVVGDVYAGGRRATVDSTEINISGGEMVGQVWMQDPNTKSNLGMLNISYSAVTDLSPLDGLNLERLTMVKTDVEEEEILRYSEVNPACWVVYKGDQPYGKGWRYDQDGSQSAYYKKIAAPDIFNYANTSDTNW